MPIPTLLPFGGTFVRPDPPQRAPVLPGPAAADFGTSAGGQTADPLEPHDPLEVRVKQNNKRVQDSPASPLTGEPRP